MEEQFVSLDTLAQGAVVEKFEDEFNRVLENVQDPNTKATATRSITITVTLKPDEDRSFASTSVEVKAKLAPSKPVGTAIYIGRHAGRAVATERDSRQMTLPEENVVAMKGGTK